MISNLKNLICLILIVGILFTLSVDCAKKSSRTSSSARLSRIKVRGKWFVDEQDRVITFRGINAVMKKFPWVPNQPDNDMTNATQVANLRKWGFNVVRLGVMWSGVMPARDFINQTYINEILGIVDLLAANDIYVIIDLHQDMLSSKL